jgi:hypothetical protein
MTRIIAVMKMVLISGRNIGGQGGVIPTYDPMTTFSGWKCSFFKIF